MTEAVRRRFTFVQNNVLLTTIFTIGAISFVLMANDGAKGADKGSFTSGDGIVGLVIATLSLALGARALMAGLYLTDAEVRVRNLFRTRTFEWSEVEGFDVRSRSTNMTAAAVVRRSGKPVRVSTLAPWNRLSRKPLEQLDAVVDQLNEIALSRTGVAPRPEPEREPSARKSAVAITLVTLYLFGFSEFVGVTMFQHGDRTQGLTMMAAGLGPLGAGAWSVLKAARDRPQR